MRPAATWNWSAGERELIYKAFVLTGLRLSELASITVGNLDLDAQVPYIVLNAADEKNRKGAELPVRDDLARDIRSWLADKLRAMQEKARQDGEAIPMALPPTMPMFYVPTGLRRILDRDLVAAGIARMVKDPVTGKARIDKSDERGRTIDVHALRHTFASLLSKGGVAPRTAQAAMRHSDIKLTMQTYTDPKLLDVRGGGGGGGGCLSRVARSAVGRWAPGSKGQGDGNRWSCACICACTPNRGKRVQARPLVSTKPNYPI